jgi:hypothetical protein
MRQVSVCLVGCRRWYCRWFYSKTVNVEKITQFLTNFDIVSKQVVEIIELDVDDECAQRIDRLDHYLQEISKE